MLTELGTSCVSLIDFLFQFVLADCPKLLPSWPTHFGGGVLVNRHEPLLEGEVLLTIEGPSPASGVALAGLAVSANSM